MNKKFRWTFITMLLVFTACGGAVEKSVSDREPSAVMQEEEVLKVYEGELELPVTGATGYASVPLQLKVSPNLNAETMDIVPAGTAFKIMKEEGEWWAIKRGAVSGWLSSNYCFINLPDVIPSIVYDNTNTYSSKFASSGKAIPNVSGGALYTSKAYNKRLGRKEYIMPVLYSMSKKIHIAQQSALLEGNSLKLYEGYRPYSAQIAVVEGLKALAANDTQVMAGINTPPWKMSWFIVDGVSNHQMGYGMDVSLVKVNEKQEIAIGEYSATNITDYTEYTMPTPIHELSGASAVFTDPVSSQSAEAWKNTNFTASMNNAAIRLQAYCTGAGLTPLASEWWHFNDLDARDETANQSSDGMYVLTEVWSSTP